MASATLPSVPDIAPEISTRAISVFFLYFERAFGHESLLRAMVRIGGEPTLEYVLDPENFVSLEYLERVARVLTEEAGDPHFLRKAGEHQLDNPRMLGFAFYLARSLGSPQLYYRMAVKTAPSFNRVGEISIEALTDRRVEKPFDTAELLSIVRELSAPAAGSARRSESN